MSVGIWYTGLSQCFPKNRATLDQKLGEEKDNKNPFPAILCNKNNPTTIKLGGGGKVFMALPLRKELIFAAPLSQLIRRILFIHPRKKNICSA